MKTRTEWTEIFARQCQRAGGSPSVATHRLAPEQGGRLGDRRRGSSVWWRLMLAAGWLTCVGCIEAEDDAKPASDAAASLDAQDSRDGRPPRDGQTALDERVDRERGVGDAVASDARLDRDAAAVDASEPPDASGPRYMDFDRVGVWAECEWESLTWRMVFSFSAGRNHPWCRTDHDLLDPLVLLYLTLEDVRRVGVGVHDVSAGIAWDNIGYLQPAEGVLHIEWLSDEVMDRRIGAFEGPPSQTLQTPLARGVADFEVVHPRGYGRVFGPFEAWACPSIVGVDGVVCAPPE